MGLSVDRNRCNNDINCHFVGVITNQGSRIKNTLVYNLTFLENERRVPTVISVSLCAARHFYLQLQSFPVVGGKNIMFTSCFSPGHIFTYIKNNTVSPVLGPSKGPKNVVSYHRPMTVKRALGALKWWSLNTSGLKDRFNCDIFEVISTTLQ